MKIRMRVHILGTRNGVRWPARGGIVDLPEREAEKLCAAGLADKAAETETATPAVAEKSAPPRAEKPARPAPESRGRGRGGRPTGKARTAKE